MAYDDAWLATHRAKMARLPDQVETPAAKKRRRDLEGPVHMAIVEFLDLMLPEPLKALHFANGEKRDKRAAGRLKAMGLKAGAADIIVLGWMKGAVPSFIWFEVRPLVGSASGLARLVRVDRRALVPGPLDRGRRARA